MNFNLKVRDIRVMFITILSHIFAEIAFSAVPIWYWKKSELKIIDYNYK